MPDVEKVVKALEEVIAEAEYPDRPRKFMMPLELAEDALALLKAQEPRVMTLGEAKSAYVIEYRSGKMREIGSALLDLNVDPLNAEYGKIYRVWTSRPTEAEREAVKWE